MLTVAVNPAVRGLLERQMTAVGLSPERVDEVSTLDEALGGDRAVDVVVVDLDRCGDRATDAAQRLLDALPDALLIAIAADPAAVGPFPETERVFCVTAERLESFVLWDTVCDVLRFVGFSKAVRPVEPSDTSEFRKLLEASADGIVIVSGTGTVRYVNPRAHEILGHVDVDVVGRVLATTGNVGGTTELELDAGRVVEVLTAMTTWEQSPAFIASIRDATAQKRTETELRQLNRHLQKLAHTDALTGALNRRGLATVLAGDLADKLRTAILLDLDDFKRVNEAHGHNVGDAVLAEVGQAIRDALRPSDHVARIGGDEFLVMIEGDEEIAGTRAAERIRLVVGSVSVQVDDAFVRPTASVGVSILPSGPRAIDFILERTRATLATGKSGGKNQVGTEGARGVIADVVSRLYRGDGLTAVAQPIVDVSTDAIVGHELLSRGPEGVSAMPRELFRLSSEHGILRSVDLSCLAKCVERAGAMPADLVYHVNLYGSTILKTPVDDLVRILDAGGEHARRYCVEVCGALASGDVTLLAERIDRIRGRGIAIAIDIEPERTPIDVVLTLAPEFVKIDRRFTTAAVADPARCAVLGRLVGILRDVGCEPIAEGIESDAERAVIADLGVRHAQGFLWGRPA